jgi:hypothetical protein
MSLVAVSKHLIVLEKAGLANRRRNGWVHSPALEAKPMKKGAGVEAGDPWDPFRMRIGSMKVPIPPRPRKKLAGLGMRFYTIGPHISPEAIA